GDERAIVCVRSLLLPGHVVEGAITNDRSASRQSRPKPIQVGWLRLVGQRISGIQRTVLQKHECVAVDSVDTGLSHYVDWTTRTSARLSGQPVIDYLELLYGLRRQFRAYRAAEFIVVFYAIDIEAIAARTQASEGKTAVAKSPVAAARSLNV